MTSRANHWSEAEILCLISVRQERSVAEILDGKDRNNKACDIMVEKMKHAGYNNGQNYPKQGEVIATGVYTCQGCSN